MSAGKDPYKDKLRVRVAGILLIDSAILLTELLSPVTNELIWTPPGGGVEFGERTEDALKREFKEETGLSIEVGEMVFLNEFVELPFHAIELFFLVNKISGDLITGTDPEHEREQQLIQNVGFKSIHELEELNLKPESLRKYLK